MDINYLLHREQVSLMMARRAVGHEAQHAHRSLALAYAKQLRDGGFPHRAPSVRALALPSENPDRNRATQ